MSTALPTPATTAIARPSATSSSVTHMFETSSEWSTFSECQVSTGEASVRLSTPGSEATPCHIKTKATSSAAAGRYRLTIIARAPPARAP